MDGGGLLLTAVVFLPLLGALATLLLPADRPKVALWTGLLTTLGVFALSLGLLWGFDAQSADLQMAWKIPWFPEAGIFYSIGLDGVSLWLVLLTTFLGPIVILNAFSSVESRVREYVAAMLMLMTGMLGAFVAIDLVLFYVFWEVMLIPMYLLIGVWGGPRRRYAAIKFFLFTMVGGLMMLAAIIYLHIKSPGSGSFDLYELYALQLSKEEEVWLFLAFALAFAIKVPLFPLHTWLPDAHVEAPTGGSVILAGVLLKLGTYGFLRFAMPLFPAATAELAPWIAGLAVVGIVYGSLVALAQRDMKKLVAYSSVAHLGFVVLGLFAVNAEGVSGAILQMVNHGVSTGALFLIVGVVYERRHTRLLADFGGLAKVAPVYAAVTMVVLLSSVGLPGTNGFVGEFLILVGTFASPFLPGAKVMAVVAASGVVLGAVYMLRMYRRVMLGPITHPENAHLKDLSAREVLMFSPLLALIVVIGLFPGYFLKPMQPSVNALVDRIQNHTMPPARLSSRPATGANVAAARAGSVARDAAASERGRAQALPIELDARVREPLLRRVQEARQNAAREALQRAPGGDGAAADALPTAAPMPIDGAPARPPVGWPTPGAAPSTGAR